VRKRRRGSGRRGGRDCSAFVDSRSRASTAVGGSSLGGLPRVLE